MGWTEAERQHLIYLWNVKKLTAAQCAPLLNKTRESVCGKVVRTPECEERGSPIKKLGSGKRPRAKRPGQPADPEAASREYFKQPLDVQRGE